MFMLTLHIAIAVMSIAIASYVYVRPTRNGLLAGCGGILSTVVSGTALIFMTDASIVHACIAGLIFVGILVALLVLTQQKLAAERIRRK